MTIDRVNALRCVPALAAIAILAACSADKPVDESTDGSAEAAADMVAAGREKSMPCLACHGAEGISDHEIWPDLAGQHAEYLAKQLRDFRDGRRYDPWMSPMAIGLDDRDIDDLSVYFSQLAGMTGGPQSAPPEAMTCVACHSERAGAASPLWPSLAGQNDRYIAKQLMDFRAGRRTDPVMAPLAQPLSDADIAAVAAHYASQRGAP
ncbi:MAG: c-type cytochrome [Gammaproteobacteria bacterium]